ncbi:hypothetical protein TD95_001274 [Thielaviopsis punctulata]|uniref:Long chronological lifespan protein 2 n=1 Tax=Thielaviopsis punctulata TaxID=72032 RepID=A0A0F4ZB45_9PEZI|nr:hypothetical protein TD95_001274 [Thielaviopsis punctulata]
MQLFGLVSFFLCLGVAQAQFGDFFGQMFGQQNSGGPRRQQASSDSAGYRQLYDSYTCDNYICPDTLACVHHPHHCPCAWPDHTDKFEMGETGRICVSKGGFKAGEAARKLELARQGKL